MTPGIPGAGIGGLFYLAASAVLMVRHAWRRVRRQHVAGESRRVLLLAGLAVGIALGIWLAGWLVGAMISPDLMRAARSGQATVFGGNVRVDNVVRIAALIAGIGTLAIVMLGVEIARLWHRYLGVIVLVAAGGLQAQGTLIARADSAFAAEDRALARQLYQEALRLEPEHSRAVFRLAQLEPVPERALALYERYVALEPGDPWGHMALGDQLARMGRFREADAAYNRAAKLAPNESEVRAGRARIRQLEARNAPALEPIVAYQRDSDGNISTRMGIGGDFSLAPGVRGGLAVSRGSIRDDAESVDFTDAALRLSTRTAPGLRFDADAGFTGFGPAAAIGAWSTPRADARLRWQTPNAISLELRAQHNALGGAPILIANRVTRSDARGTLQLPLGPLRIRGNARAGVISARGEPGNRRLDAGAALVAPLGSGEVAARYQTVGYARTSGAGYFAPRLVQTLEGATYFELGADGPFSFSADLGAGMQRMARHAVTVPLTPTPPITPGPGRPGTPGAPAVPRDSTTDNSFGMWKSALRAWTYSAFSFAPGRALWVELEAYDAPFAPHGVSAAPSWRFISISGGLRWSLR